MTCDLNFLCNFDLQLHLQITNHFTNLKMWWESLWSYEQPKLKWSINAIVIVSQIHIVSNC